MTKLEERLNDLADKYTDNNRPRETSEYSGEGVYRFKDIEEAYKAGARAVLEMPELKALVVALDKYGNSSEDVAVSMPYDNLDPDDFPIVEEFESGEPEDFGTKARQVVTQWRSFIGEVDK